MSMTGTTVIHCSPTMAQTHPLSSIENDGSCWTCVARHMYCDKGLPGRSDTQNNADPVDCKTCAREGFVCEGYATRLHWNTSVIHNSNSYSDDLTLASNGDFRRKRRQSSCAYAVTKQFPGLSMSLLRPRTDLRTPTVSICKLYP